MSFNYRNQLFDCVSLLKLVSKVPLILLADFQLLFILLICIWQFFKFMTNIFTFWKYDSPTHPLNGSPVNSSLQVQTKLPTVSVHKAFSPQGLSSHSFTSEKQVSYLHYWTQYIPTIATFKRKMPYHIVELILLLQLEVPSLIFLSVS
jgi:hypothetical protein